MKRLDSWKQIAAYVGKDIRTVQLWEKNEGLPVHRLTHHARANVFAYDTELDQWLRVRHAPPPAQRPRRWPWVAAAMVLPTAAVIAIAVEHDRPVVVAVLPFADSSASGDHLSDGLTDDIIIALGRAGQLPVISRTSTASLTKPAAALHANVIVQGTLQRSGSTVRINADLVDLRSHRRVWSEHYERDVSEVLSSPDEVAGSIAASVLSELTGKTVARRPPRRPVNPGARLAYLTGRYFWAKRNEAGLTKAIEYFNQAIASSLAHVHVQFAISGSSSMWS